MSWRNTREYRIWRVQVIRRDKVCQICGSNQERNAHHLDSASYFADKRYLPNNGVTLCRQCHTNFHTNFKRSYRTKCTEYDYNNFVCLTNYYKSIFIDKDENKNENI